MWISLPFVAQIIWFLSNDFTTLVRHQLLRFFEWKVDKKNCSKQEMLSKNGSFRSFASGVGKVIKKRRRRRKREEECIICIFESVKWKNPANKQRMCSCQTRNEVCELKACLRKSACASITRINKTKWKINKFMRSLKTETWYLWQDFLPEKVIRRDYTERSRVFWDKKRKADSQINECYVPTTT